MIVIGGVILTVLGLTLIKPFVITSYSIHYTKLYDLIGVFMLDIIKINFPQSNHTLNGFKKKLVSKGFIGSFLLGVLFATAFCPFSAVLYFGMIIPLALKQGDFLVIPSVFAIATGLPVILFSILLVKSVYNRITSYNVCYTKLLRW